MNGLCWIRRDLRLQDHLALRESLLQCKNTFVAFILDKNILSKLKVPDKRLEFILYSLAKLNDELGKHNSQIILRYGDPLEEIPSIIKDFKIDKLFFNRDYESYALERDKKIFKIGNDSDFKVQSFKDHLIFEPHEIKKGDGSPYKVYTPFKNKWLELFHSQQNISKYNCNLKRLAPFSEKQKKSEHKNFNDLIKKHGFFDEGFILENIGIARKKLKSFEKKITNYDEARDFPSKEATSNLSVHLRHGTLSIRQAMSLAISKPTKGHKSWLNELIWREFYQHILVHFPKVEQKPFRSQYENINWPGQATHFTKWKQGQTGFPIIDAAMRNLNLNGKMPNRLRMVTASFLCKTLLIDWKKGEKYFAQKLLDFDLAANNGGWQWCASTGTDAQPYFRIFNPYSQSKKFDKDADYILKFCPELASLPIKFIHEPHLLTEDKQQEFDFKLGQDYPLPVVDYAENRSVALDLYKNANTIL